MLSNFQEIRRSVCCKLAETLLHGISDIQYVRPGAESPYHKRGGQQGGSNSVSHRLTPSGSATGMESPWKPRKHAGSNLYSPKNKYEEVILLLLLSENMARREAILSQAPEFFGMRSTKFRDAIITYDLTAIALSRIRNFKLLTNMLEHSMKFSFNEPHTWTQFGLSLATEGKHFRALMVFRELAERNQADAGSCLVAAKLCYERLHRYAEGLTWAETALKKGSATADHFLKARCNIYLGIGNVLLVKTTENHSERSEFFAKALKYFEAARAADEQDHLAEYYLAYYHALTRNIPVATSHARKALALNPEHLATLHLVILLLSANKDFEEALEVADQTLEEFPDNLPILSLKVRLEEIVNGGESAVKTAKCK